MPYKRIDSCPPEERETELARRRELRRKAKQRSRARQREKGIKPAKDTRKNRKRPDMAAYMRERRAKKVSEGPSST